MTEFLFNSNDHEPDDFDLLPESEYTAVINHAELKATRSGGERISFSFKIIEGRFRDRYVFESLNVKNASAKAQKIALSQLSSICRAVGVEQMNHLEELYNKPLRIKVGIQPGTNGYSDQNNIKRYSSAGNGHAYKPEESPVEDDISF